jgi:hypothetical protein
MRGKAIDSITGVWRVSGGGECWAVSGWQVGRQEPWRHGRSER